MISSDRYQIERELGRGACGITYLATDPVLQREVALKLLVVPHTLQGSARTDHIERFIREARAACAIRHPGVPEIYEIGREGDEYFIAMEYCPGQTLREVLADQNSLSLDESLRMTRQVLEILHQAHLLGIYHRDIKPDNLMLSPDEQSIKVMDFGIARTVGDETLTRTGAPIGTPSYMSPEQALGERVDGRSDLFSVTILLHELLTGTRPFAGTTLPQLLHAIVYSEPTISPDLPAAVARIIRQGLEKEPDRRFADAEQMRAALEALGGDGGIPPSAYLPPLPDPTTPPDPFAPTMPSGPLNPFGPLNPSGVAVPTRMTASSNVPTLTSLSGPALGLGAPLGLLISDLWSRREVRQLTAAGTAFLGAAVLLGAVFVSQQSPNSSHVPARSASFKLGRPVANRSTNSPAGASGRSTTGGGIGNSLNYSTTPYVGSGMPPGGLLPAGPPPAAPPPVPTENYEAFGPGAALRRVALQPGQKGQSEGFAGGLGITRRMDAPPSKRSLRPKRTDTMASAQWGRQGSAVPDVLNAPATQAGRGSVSVQVPSPGGVPSPPAAEVPQVSTEPSPPTPQPSPATTASAPPVRSTRPTPTRAIAPPRIVRQNRVRGGEREVYTITGEEALNYGIRTSKRMPNPDRYGYWYQTIPPHEAWEQYRMRYRFPIPDPNVYGRPPVPLHKLPPPGDLLNE